jgi:tetratricopeptide (TPR) repeat protein
MRSSLLRLAFLLAACSPAAAQSGRDEAVAWCEGPNVAQAQVVAGCTWLIEAGSEGFRGTAAAHARRGHARRRAGDRAGALEDYTDAIGFDRRNPAVCIDRGHALLAFDLGRAAADFSEAIRLSPNHAAAHRLRGDAKRLAGDPEGAIADYTESIRLDPRSAEAFCMRGFAKRDKRDWKGALADYGEAIRLRPGYADAYALRSTARKALGDQAGARADVEEAIRLDPNNVMGFNNRGLLRYDEVDFAGAAADHDRTIRIDPTFVRAWRNRANARSYLGDKEGAIADYTEALRLEPDHAEARIARAWIRRATGDLEGALDDYLEDRKLPDAEGVPANLCITLFRLGRREEAMQNCKQGQRDAAAGDAKPFATEAGVLLLAGDLAGAEAALAEALRRDPRSAHALRLRSVVHARRGDLAAADRDIAAARQIAPWMEQLARDAYGHALFR